MILLLACAPAPDCAEGYTAQADGTCLGEATAPFSGGDTMDEVLDALAPCVPMAASDRVDLDGACVDGACARSTFAELDEALGGTGVCVSADDDPLQAVYARCTWPVGIEAAFNDRDDDGVPDADALAYPLRLVAPYDGATPDGLGLDAGFACFVDAFGTPDSVSLVNDGENWWPGGFWWRTDNVWLGWSPESGPWDGTPSWMWVI
ncbi:MAG: hypothetical protein V4850_29635 [Myxococcota bacterium]